MSQTSLELTRLTPGHRNTIFAQDECGYSYYLPKGATSGFCSSKKPRTAYLIDNEQTASFERAELGARNLFHGAFQFILPFFFFTTIGREVPLTSLDGYLAAYICFIPLARSEFHILDS